MSVCDGGYNGILIMDKPSGFTSFDLCAKLRGMLKTKRIGHAGTLDPMATGVMTVLLGRATRAAELLPSQEKRYLAAFQFGMRTDTLDITGSITENNEYAGITCRQVEEVLCDFRGDIMQLPPMYSAVHSDGKRLYQLARQGIDVERQPRRVTVSELSLLCYDEKNGCGELDIFCSKGTYIRSLVDDIGTALGCGAVLTSLRRTWAAGFGIEDALMLEQAQKLCDDGGIEKYIIPVERAFDLYPRVDISNAQGIRYANGGELDILRLKNIPAIADGSLVRVFSPDGFIGLGKIYTSETGCLKPYKRFI